MAVRNTQYFSRHCRKLNSFPDLTTPFTKNIKFYIYCRVNIFVILLRRNIEEIQKIPDIIIFQEKLQICIATPSSII